MQQRQVAQRMADELLSVGARPGGVLLVHSSLSAMGHVIGGAETVIQGLLEALGPEGTLLMPALSYEIVTPERSTFDVRRTPSNVGAIPEHFRTRPGTRRSVHPTHSACGIGPFTEALLGEHILDITPCGPHSPFRHLRDVGGQILMLGCGLKPNTSIHGIEELVEPPYLFGPLLVHRLVLADGHVQRKAYRQHNFVGWVQRYDRVEALLRQDGLKTGYVLDAKAYLLEASALWDAALTALRGDPLFFVDRADEIQT